MEPIMWQHENQAAAVPSSQMGELYFSVFVVTKVVWNYMQYP
jgi:hypothetical protein